MPVQQQTSQQYFKGLYILHIAFIIGLFVFSIIAAFLVITGAMGQDKNNMNSILQFLVPVLVIGGIIGGLGFYRSRLNVIKQTPELKDKLGNYRGAMILRVAMMEFPALFSIIAFLLTGNYLFLGLAGLVIIIFLMLIPLKERVSNDLELSTQERSIISDPNAIVAEVETKQ